MATVSIKKNINGGVPVAKDKTVIWIPYESVDFTQFPARDANGVLITGNIVLKAGHEAIGIETTPTDISRKHTTEGEDDAYGVIQETTFVHPGDDLEVSEFMQKHLGEEGFLVTKACVDSTKTRLNGTPCNPVRLTVEDQDDKEGVKKMFTVRSVQRGKFFSAHYRGAIPALADFPAEGSGSAGGGV